MPPGYEYEGKRRHLEEELRKARAAELATADKQKRALIEREIKEELGRRLGKRPTGGVLGQILW